MNIIYKVKDFLGLNSLEQSKTKDDSSNRKKYELSKELEKLVEFTKYCFSNPLHDKYVGYKKTVKGEVYYWVHKNMTTKPEKYENDYVFANKFEISERFMPFIVNDLSKEFKSGNEVEMYCKSLGLDLGEPFKLKDEPCIYFVFKENGLYFMWELEKALEYDNFHIMRTAVDLEDIEEVIKDKKNIEKSKLPNINQKIIYYPKENCEGFNSRIWIPHGDFYFLSKDDREYIVNLYTKLLNEDLLFTSKKEVKEYLKKE